MKELIGFTRELRRNQTNTLIGVCLAKLVLLGIYVK